MTIRAARATGARAPLPAVPELAATEDARLRIALLGPLVLSVSDTPVPLPPAQRRLAACLLLAPGSVLTADELIDLMWGESPPRTALQALHVHLSALRRRMPGVIALTPAGYRATLDALALDVPEFEALAAQAADALANGHFLEATDAASRAGALWRGEPFPELVDLEVARGERERLTELWIATRAVGARARVLQGHLSQAIGELRQLVAEQPLNEPLWEELVLAYCAAGRMAEARAALESARTTLEAELDVRPGPRLVALERRVDDRDPTLLSFPAPVVATNLPMLDTSFVGREAELATVEELLGSHHLVTLAGPPGIGKTRLALEVARQVATDYPDGVWLVRLAATRTAAEVASAIAAELGVNEPIEELADLYRLVAGRRSLIILDNADGLAGMVVEFVARRRLDDRLRILVTSRTPVSVAEEAVCPLAPISIAEDPADIRTSATMRLLSDRVTDADARIALDEADPALLTQLCRRTGGMPLAIELVARRVAMLDLRHVVRLSLSDGHDRKGHGGLPNESSVADAIERSVRLLDPADRRRLDAASAFAGAFTLEAFEHVCLRRDEAHEATHTVQRLCASSLLTAEHAADGGVRYRMLEPIRDHATTRLATAGRGRRILDRHAAWFVDAARRVARANWTDEEADVLAAAEAELPDHRAAMRHLLASGHPELAVEIAAGLTQLWISRFLGWEGRRWLSDCLAGDLDDATRMRGLAAASGVAFFIGDYDGSEALSDEAFALARRLGDRRLEAHALYGKGRVQVHRRPARGRRLIREAIALFDTIGDRLAADECRIAVGIQASYAAGRDVADAILGPPTAALEEAGYPRIAAVGHRHLALAAFRDDDEPAARRHVEAAEALAARANDRRVLSGVLGQRGMIEARWGEAGTSAAALIEALHLIRGQHGIYFSLVAFGALELLVRVGRWSTAARLLDHFDRIHVRYGWIPLDDRNAAAPAYRASVAAGLAASGTQPDLGPVTTRAMADQLIETLEEVLRGEPELTGAGAVS